MKPVDMRLGTILSLMSGVIAPKGLYPPKGTGLVDVYAIGDEKLMSCIVDVSDIFFGGVLNISAYSKFPFVSPF